MKPLMIAEDILSVGQFKASASRIVREVRDEGRRVVITEDGRPAAVILSPAEYDRLAEREHFVAAVQQGLEDVEAGLIIDDESLDEELDAEFGRLD